MECLQFDLQKKYGAFKPLNCTNGGPWHRRHTNDQYRTNLEDYKAAKIPYSRNHDSAMCSIYGGPYCHDITALFPNFDADPDDPASYDFACTDEAILVSLDAGTKTFFRLGQSIEHQIKKHGTIPPKDFHKWAVICEHVIRHYTEGWADGFYHDMPYWEIWNEPDLDRDESKNKRMWGGTQAQFFDFYEIASKHLKACFPHLKIGGPALAWSEEWADDFMREMKQRGAPLDFFSWHIYTNSPKQAYEKSEHIHALLEKNGWCETESILNEWNYIEDWNLQFIYSLKAMHGIKGAAFTMATISLAQSSTIDMLMYYDTRPSVYCGLFDFYTYEKLKGYYPFLWYSRFYDMQHEIRAVNEVEDIYPLCGCDENGKVLAVLTYYTNDDNASEKTFRVDFGKDADFELLLLDEAHDAEPIPTPDDLILTMPRNSCILIREK